MAELDTIVAVSITADSKNPTRAGFGTPCIMSYHTRFADTYREYSALSEMATDGFTTADDAYNMAAAVFNANPGPLSVIVGRLSAAPAYTRVLTITSAVEGEHVKCKVRAPVTGAIYELDYTIGAAETTTTVATAVELLIDNETNCPGVTSSSSVADITVTPTVAGRQVFIYDLENCTIEDTTADANFDDALTALEIVNDDWYWVLISSGSEANIDLVAAWVESRKKIFGATVSDSAELTSGGTIGNGLAGLEYERTFTIFSKRPDQFAAARWVGYMAARSPGTYVAALKSLSGVTADSLTTTEKGYLEGDNMNHYMSVRGIGITRNGLMANGDTYIDNRHGTDALMAAIQEAVYTVFVNADKVPYTDAGFDIVRAAILSAMQAFEGTVDEPGLLVPGSSAVIMPLASAALTADRLARRLTNVRFSAQYSNGIQSATLVGNLST